MRSIPRAGGLPLLGALPSFIRDPLALLRRVREAGDVSRLELGFLDGRSRLAGHDVHALLRYDSE